MKSPAIIFLLGFLAFTNCGVKKVTTQSSDLNRNIVNLEPTPSMHENRASHTATLLPKGKVLIAGGFKKGPDGYSQIYFNTAEIFDPSIGEFKEIRNMNESRCGHTATLLPNEKILLLGGWNENGMTASVELFDPQTNEFIQIGDMMATRVGMTATLLKNGKVLIAGGFTDGNKSQLTSETFDPATNKFTTLGNINIGRAGHTATLLNDGRVLIIGGSEESKNVLSSAEIYDPDTQEFTLTSSMKFPRHKHASILLNDGNVLVAGGSDDRDWTGKYSAAEIYDISTGKFTQIENMNSERFKFPNAIVQLKNGNIFIGGGSKQLEIFDSATKNFKVAAQLDEPFYYSSITLLNDGNVLITGGYNDKIQVSNKGWIYKTL